MQNGFSFWNFIVDAFVIFLFVMWIWLLILVISDLFRRSDMGGFAKVIWLIFLLILPYLSVFVYLMTQGTKMGERDAKAASAARENLRNMVGFSVADELKKLDALKADGAITAAEYQKLRAKLI